MKILYSFNKTGIEAELWEREISAASYEGCQFIPFNVEPYLNPQLYVRAQLLDNLYYEMSPRLMAMYADLERTLTTNEIDALIVDTCHPYHPDFLRRIKVHKVIRTNDGPMTAYDRDFAYLHAYDQVLYHSPAYSRDMEMAEKLKYCGAKRADFWPLWLFDAAFDTEKTEDTILSSNRDIDIIFIGALYVGKMPLLAKVKKYFGPRCKMFGLTSLKKNIYFNLKYGFPGWLRPLPFDQFVQLYQRSRIGFNVHNRGDYTVGSFRLFDLPGNGVMQISDGGKFLNEFFKVGEEIVGYSDADDLIKKLVYYLDHEDERQRIALNGFRRAVKDHRFSFRMRQAAELIARAIGRTT